MENTETPEKVETRKYELMMIFSPDLGEKGRDKELEEVRKLISEYKGTVSFEDIWDIRDLAHKIKKQEQGLYVVWNFETPDGSLINELESHLILSQDVLRHLVTKVSNSYSAKSAAQYKEEAEEAEAEKEREEAEKQKEKEKKSSKPPVKKEVKKEVKEEKPEKKEPVVAVEEEPEEEEKDEQTDKEKEAEAKEKLDEVDKKLKSIIDDPDISL